MSGLDENEWPVDADGYPHRQAARVILFDENGRLLLAKGHDRDQPERQWWFTIGGGIMEGENPAEAACRELFEETGIVLEPDTLVGPVIYREATFDFLSVTAKQDEWFFIAHTQRVTLNDDGWTDLERDVIDEQRWWDLDELAQRALNGEVYPLNLATLAQSWVNGWDGQLHRIRESSACSGSSEE